jgi:hypothetical protein
LGAPGRLSRHDGVFVTSGRRIFNMTQSVNQVEIWSQIIALKTILGCVVEEQASRSGRFNAFMREQHAEALKHFAADKFGSAWPEALIRARVEQILDEFYINVREDPLEDLS